MKTHAILRGVALAAVAVSLALLPSGLAAQQVGDNFTVIVPAGKITDLKKVLVVTGQPKQPVKVGNCATAEVRFLDANVVDRAEKEAAVATEVALVLPGGTGVAELKPGWSIGSWRAGGKCGPGYEVFLAHIIAIK